jgi:hypothetical protein
VIVVRVSDDDGTTRASTSGTIGATGTNDGVSVWRDSDQRKECEQSGGGYAHATTWVLIMVSRSKSRVDAALELPFGRRVSPGASGCRENKK